MIMEGGGFQLEDTGPTVDGRKNTAPVEVGS